MAATFIVEDGTGKTDSNAYCSVEEADQYHENHGNPVAWSGAIEATKQNAIREATRCMDLTYNWKFLKANMDQALEWPKRYVVDKNGFAIAANVVPVKIKEACAFLALQVVNGESLIPNFTDESAISKISSSIGPLSESIEYAGAEKPGTTYSIADALVRDFVNSSSGIVGIERA